jgi:hypothetical protein
MRVLFERVAQHRVQAVPFVSCNRQPNIVDTDVMCPCHNRKDDSLFSTQAASRDGWFPEKLEAPIQNRFILPAPRRLTDWRNVGIELIWQCLVSHKFHLHIDLGEVHTARIVRCKFSGSGRNYFTVTAPRNPKVRGDRLDCVARRCWFNSTLRNPDGSEELAHRPSRNDVGRSRA